MTGKNQENNRPVVCGTSQVYSSAWKSTKGDKAEAGDKARKEQLGLNAPKGWVVGVMRMMMMMMEKMMYEDDEDEDDYVDDDGCLRGMLMMTA